MDAKSLTAEEVSNYMSSEAGDEYMLASSNGIAMYDGDYLRLYGHEMLTVSVLDASIDDILDTYHKYFGDYPTRIVADRWLGDWTHFIGGKEHA
jgi:hypothetical protein